MYNSTDLVLKSFRLMRKSTLFRIWQNIRFFYYFHLLTLSSRETRSFCDIFFELCIRSFVMHPLQNSPLFSSTILIFFFLLAGNGNCCSVKSYCPRRKYPGYNSATALQYVDQLSNNLVWSLCCVGKGFDLNFGLLQPWGPFFPPFLLQIVDSRSLKKTS